MNLGNAIEWFFAKGMPCVILIDEYDDPVAKALADPAGADESWVGDTVRHLRRCEFDDYFWGRKSLFAHLPYGAKEGRVHEMGYERALKILFWSQGLETVCEDRQLVDAAVEELKVERLR